MTSSPPSSVNDPFAGMGFSASAGADSPMLGKSNLDSIDGSEGGLSEPDSVQSLASLGAPVNTGPSLVLVTSHHLVCRGIYQASRVAGTCFCCQESSKKSCPQSHSAKKHSCLSSTDTDLKLVQPRIYLRVASARSSSVPTVHAEPYLEVGNLSMSQVNELLHKQISSFDEWVHEIGVYDAVKSSGDDPLVLRTAVKNLSKVSRLGDQDIKVAVSALATTFDAALDFEPELEDTSMPSATLQLQASYSALDTVDGLIVATSDDTISAYLTTLRDVAAKIDLIPEVFSEVRKDFQLRLHELQTGTSLSVSALKRMLGSGQGDGSTIWGAIDMLRSGVGWLSGSAYAKQLSQVVLSDPGLKGYMLSTKTAFQNVVSRLTKLESNSQAPSVPLFPTGLHSGNASGPPSPPDVASAPVVMSLQARVAQLELEAGAGTTTGDDVAVTYNGVRFSSETDVQAYFEKLGGGVYDIPPGLVWDSYAIFSELFRETFQGGNSKLDLDKMVKLGKHDDVYHIQAACEHGVPSFFDCPTSSSQNAFYTDGKSGKKSRFRNIPSFDHWGAIGTVKTCVRNAAKSDLDRLVRSSRQEINLVSEPVMKTFLLNMLDTSRAFVEAVFEFLTEEYTAFTEHFPDDKICWDFACSCVEHVFKYEFETARSVLRNPDLRSNKAGLQVMWTALRTISVQESFLKVGFKNHSSLASAYSRFLLTQYQTSSTELQDVKKKVSTFSSKFESQENEMNDLKRKFKVVEGTANAAHKASSKKGKRGDDD